jgi:hypothetical protein
MTKSEEAKIRREGFPLSRAEAWSLLQFIDLFDKEHNAIESEIVVKLEVLAGKQEALSE